ncbi:MAG TPA: flagellin [Opitutaceae bacterium]|nr:flagellin [Opitutaceae bacterium]
MSSTSFTNTSFSLAQGLGRTQEFLGRSISRLSSGNRILNPSDDPQAVGATAKLDSQTRRNQAATNNVQNAISHVQSADSLLSAMSTTLTRLSELATRAKDPMQSPADIALYNEEFTTLLQQLRDTVGGTTSQIGGTADVSDPSGVFNGRQLFADGPGLRVSVGLESDQTLEIPASNLRTSAFAAIITQDAGGNFLLSVDDAAAVSSLKDALDVVGSERASLGGAQSRLVLLSQTLTVEGENLSSAVSRIRDADVAKETTQMTKLQLLTQTTTEMLTQTNQSPRSVLRLLES